MSNQKTLIATGDIQQILNSIAATPEALEQKAKIIKLAVSIEEVNDEESYSKATEIGATVKGYLNGVEKGAKAHRDPFNAANKAIIKVENDLSLDVDKELKRIEKLRAAYLQEKERKAEAERQRIAAEQEKVRKEQQRIADEAARLEREKAAAIEAAAKAKTAKAKEAAAAELKRIENEKEDQEFAQAAVEERAEAIEATEVPGNVLEGSGARKDFEIELTDALLFFTNFPEFCEVTIKKNPLKEFLKVHWTPASVFPGVKITPKFSAPVKGVNPLLAIQ